MNASPTTDTQTDRTAPIALWRAAQAFMHILHALFGAPEEVAFKHTLTRKAHELMASWLRSGEAMMRRLLLIEAQSFAKPNTRPLLHAPHKHTRKPAALDPDAPEQWRVSFRCFVERPRPHGAIMEGKPAGAPALHTRRFIVRDRDVISANERARSPNHLRRKTKRPKRQPILRQDREWVQHQAPLAFRDATPLAKRYEALLRVFNAPIAFARRLARRLHARPYRLRELLRAPPETEHRVENYFALCSATEASAAVFNTS